MMELLVEPVSTYAGDIDFLILMVTVVVGFWFLASEAMFFWLLWKYRFQDGKLAQYITGNEPELKRWITIPHALIIVCDLFLIVGAVKVWYDIKQDLPPASQTVRVIAQQWAWTFQHPGADGKLDTDDDILMVDEMHIQANTLYHYKLQSLDALHSFSIPVFRLKQDAIPGREITGWFEATKTGEFDIQCTEMCGIGHGIMGAKLVIESPEQHAAWIASASK